MMIGKRIDVDWYPKYGKFQCIDLVRHYLLNIYWWNTWAIWNANQTRTNKFKKFWKDRQRLVGRYHWVEWDIIISLRWRHGHIGIVDHDEWNYVYVLEQNGVGWGKWLWGNTIRVKKYHKSFFAWVWRNVNTYNAVCWII